MADPSRIALSPHRLAGKAAVVTGSGSEADGLGIGEAIAVLFARQGARVCLVDNNPARAANTLDLISADGGQAFLVIADVVSGDGCARIVDETVGRLGRLDVLVNCVGIVSRGAKLHEISESDWDRMFAVNVKSVALMCRAALPTMTAAGGGSIINMSSTGAVRAAGEMPAYAASKAAVIALTREIAVGYGRAGVRANAIMPGHLYTPFAAPGMTPESRELRRKIAPLGVEGNAWDVAWLALFLASNESRFITGTAIPVDAGLTQTYATQAHRFAMD